MERCSVAPAAADHWVELDGGRIRAAAAAVAGLTRAGLDRLAAAPAFAGGRLVRQAGRRRTWRVETGGGVWYVKIHLAAPAPSRWFRQPFQRLSPARREAQSLRLLAAAGVPVAELLAFAEERRRPAAGVSFLVTREIPGASLAELLAGGWPELDGRAPEPAGRRLLADLAALVRGFHDAGFYHRDLYLAHVLAADAAGGPRLHLIDLERVRRRAGPRRRWLVKDLAALESSAPPWLSRSERLRFLLLYLQKTRLDGEGRAWLRRVRAKAARIRAHAPKYP